MRVKNISFEYGDKTILKDVNFAISPGDKVGIVGENGSGKTTFFKIILGNLLPSTGEIILKKDTIIECLPQIIVDNVEVAEMSVKEYIFSARPIFQLEKKLDLIYERISNCLDENEQTNLINESEKIRQELEKLDWYQYENIVQNIVSNMKISEKVLSMKMNQLSGGQKSKVAFARILYSKKDIMLLDEPTNHLDNETKKFVIEFLKSYQGTVIIISHDVQFLNAVTNVTLYFDNFTHKIIKYNGNYSVFEKLHKEYELNLINEANKQNTEIQRLQETIKKFQGVSGKRKKMAQDREKKLEKILDEKISIQRLKNEIDFNIEKLREENNIPIRLRNINFSYSDKSKLIISDFSIDIMKKERFLIVGPNGAGKSTLLKIISGDLVQNSGEIKIGAKVDIGYYAQEHEGLIFDRNILQNFSCFNYTERQIRSKLAHFLFLGNDVYKKISSLSPGERARVALAKLAISGANVILLDEPTNHLDYESQKIISEIFNKFNGTIILVSHNIDFVEKLNIERMLVMPDGKIVQYDKNIVQKFYKINK